MDVHWHASADGETISVDVDGGPAVPVGFASWEDARECLLFAVVDGLVAVGPGRAAEVRREALLAVAAGLEAARAGWRWSCVGPGGGWSLLVCTEEDCGCEVLHGPVHGGSHRATAG